MALLQTFLASVNQAGTVITLTDTTGSYDVSGNPTGYGAPNTERTDLALIVLAEAKEVDSDTALTAGTHDPETVIAWTFSSVTIQGWQQMVVYAVPRAGTEATVTNNFRYDFATDLLERYNGATWETATNATLETYKGTNNVTATEVNYAHIAEMYKALNNVVKLIAIGCHCCGVDDLKRYRDEVDERIYGSLVIFADADYYAFQSLVENYNTRASELQGLE